MANFFINRPVFRMGGSTGVIYRQFSITIVSAMLLSVLVAIIFTPALCATFLKPVVKGHHEKKRGFFGLFNRLFNAGNRAYTAGVGYVIGQQGRHFAIYLVIIVVLGLVFVRLPKSFLPEEDQGILFAQVTTPAGTPRNYTADVLARINQHFLTKEANNVESVMTVTGFSFGGRGQSSGLAFVRLKDWSERPGANNRVQAVAARAMGEFMRYRDSTGFRFCSVGSNRIGQRDGF
jgi:multidrug efflux pump